MDSYTYAKETKEKISSYIGNNYPECYSDGFVIYRPEEANDKCVISFMGRTNIPSVDIDAGSHMLAAYAAMNGCTAYICSAHEESRFYMLACLLELENDKNIYIYGHSHGGDHASVLAAEYKQYSGNKVYGLITIDPVNSPTPLPLDYIADKDSTKIHFNYFQRNTLWYGGNIDDAEININVTNNEKFTSWSSFLNNQYSAINHCTIDEDLLFAGYLDWPFCNTEASLQLNLEAQSFCHQAT